MPLQTILAFATPVGLYLALGVVNLLLGHKSQIDAWAEANPRVASLLKLSRSLGLDPWLLVQSLSLIIRGRLPATMKLEEPKRSTIKPPPLALLALCLLLGLVSCASAPPPRPCSANDPQLPAKLADCTLRMLTECKDVEPDACAIRTECRAWVRDYCGAAQ